MGEIWRTHAAGIGGILRDCAARHREIKPLVTSFINFARKHRLDAYIQSAVPETVVVEKSVYAAMQKTIARQTEEIDALELRIKRLMEVV